MPSKGSISIAATTTPTSVFSMTLSALAALSQRRMRSLFGGQMLGRPFQKIQIGIDKQQGFFGGAVGHRGGAASEAG